MYTSSFTAKILSANTHLVALVTGKDYTGEKAWWYIRLYPGKEKLFNIVLEKGEGTELTNYGEILKSGYGNTPPQEIHDEILAKLKISNEN